MTHVTLIRTEQTDKRTRGGLWLNGNFLCYTLEESWRNNQRRISCIPESVYKCVKHKGARFKDVWEVTGVKDRDAILIHAGNTLADTEGCILVGMTETSIGVGSSRVALDMLRAMLPDTFALEVTS